MINRGKLNLIFLNLIILLTSILAIAPILPYPPALGLDASWILAMNQAISQNIVIGRELIFTFGPYSVLQTNAYHPDNYEVGLIVGLLLSICYCLFFLRNKKFIEDRLYIWLFISLIMADSRDALLLSYPLLIALHSCYSLSRIHSPYSLKIIDKIHLILSISLLGLLPLVKISIAPMVLISSLACFYTYLVNGKRMIAIGYITIPAVSMMLLWRLSGQPLDGLQDYLNSIPLIISGYAEAMSKPSEMKLMTSGPVWQIFIYIIAALGVVLNILLNNKLNLRLRIIVILILAAYLFLSYKAGFVRHDSHAQTAGYALLLTLLPLYMYSFLKISKWLNVLIILVWASIHFFYLIGSLLLSYSDLRHSDKGIVVNDITLKKYNSDKLKQYIVNDWRDVLFGNIPRVNGLVDVGGALNLYVLHNLQSVAIGELSRRDFKIEFVKGLESISNNVRLPKLAGTSDIYPFDQSALIASGNIWNTRPVIQSYSTYNSKLLKLNAAHLEGPSAPDNIIFRLDTIDHRYPTLDDGLSLPIIISKYKITGRDSNYLYFKRNQVPTSIDYRSIHSNPSKLGQYNHLPNTEEPIIASININQTLLGKVWQFVYKPPPLNIKVELIDGSIENYKFIQSMANTGFIISPRISSNLEFAMLSEGNFHLLSKNRVKGFEINANNEDNWFWDNSFTLELKAVTFHAYE